MKTFLNVIAALSVALSGDSLSFTSEIPDLPDPVANNAVTRVVHEGKPVLLSFMGLGPNKDWQDVHANAYAYSAGDEQWQRLPAVPSSLSLKGRLAAVAVGIGGSAYLFGGYTVAEDHAEISSPDNFRFEFKSRTYSPIAAMPVAVDDAVALVYQNRYIYLISGWHNDGNVNLVQVYDVQHDSWSQASPFPGAAVFGQAGGIVENVMLICDGVKVEYFADKRRGFAPEAACYRGEIDKDNPNKINWFTENHPTNTARYRMAAVGVASSNTILFMGGSDNPYNYNGVGYDGEPAMASDQVWQYSVHTRDWELSQSPHASMDHRGLVLWGGTALRIGGMINPQQVSNKVLVDNLSEYINE